VETSVGIIGDGQLGMLLCEAAPALGLQTIMLTSAPECAAARRAGATIDGAMDDSVALADLIARCDVITYEREDVPPRAIAQLREAEASGDGRPATRRLSADRAHPGQGAPEDLAR
jgi:5-(carboxyamino)imidazole ribonucleotide synthase